MKKIVLILFVCVMFIGGRAYATCVGGVEFKGTLNEETYCRSSKTMTWWAAFAWCEHNNLHLVSLQEACLDWRDATGNDACPNMMVTKDINNETLVNTLMWIANPRDADKGSHLQSGTGYFNHPYTLFRNNGASAVALCK